MKIKQENPINQEVNQALGQGGNIEFVPVLLPIETYNLILIKAKEEGCTASDIFDRALSKYFRPEPPPEVDNSKTFTKIPDIVVARKRRL
jgi:hypothetical protein